MNVRHLTALAGTTLLLALLATGTSQAQASAAGAKEDRAQARADDKDEDRRQARRTATEARENRRELTGKERQERIREQRRSVEQYRLALAEQQARHALVPRPANGQRRAAWRQDQQYRERLRIQQLNFRNASHDYDRDPYYRTAAAYRYRRDGRQYEVNRYGAATLRAALNNGYREGFRAGIADRQDQWRFSFRDSIGYRDANYGYGGRYVAQADYAHYFREGFQRGYEDGYHDRRQYGRRENGTEMLLGSLVASILNLQPLR